MEYMYKDDHHGYGFDKLGRPQLVEKVKTLGKKREKDGMFIWVNFSFQM